MSVIANTVAHKAVEIKKLSDQTRIRLVSQLIKGN